MLDLTPPRASLERIEIASRDEISALQLTRLQATLRRAYENVPHYKRAFDAAGVHPDDCRTLGDLKKFPFTQKADLRDNYPVRPVRRAARESRAAFTPPRARPASRRSSATRKRHRDLGRSGRALDPRRRRAAGHDVPCRLWLWAVHRRARRALRRRAAGLHGRARLGRHDRAAGAADQRFRARHHHGDAELHARDSRRVRASAGSTRAQLR